MEKTKIMIPGNPITKKNSQVIARTKSGRPFVIPSKAFREYEKQAQIYLPRKEQPIMEPVNVQCLYFI